MQDNDDATLSLYDWDWGNPDGPTMLRNLREATGVSQFEVALRLSDAGFRSDQAHVQKIESGAIKRPAAATLDAILTVGLNVPYRLRRDVLEAYGYRLPMALPSEEDAAVGRRLGNHELNMALWPAYLKDYADRIWGWNRQFPRLIGNVADDPANARYVGLTVADILFNPEVGTLHQIANVESFGPRFLAGFKTARRGHSHEAWYRDFMARATTWPGFLDAWNRIPDGTGVMLEDNPIVPIEVRVPGLPVPLRFRPVIVEVGLDPRFQVVHIVPFSGETMAICAAWAAEAPEE